ncbi:MAG: MBL fold metallo-hydrolase, partial [bacterium]
MLKSHVFENVGPFGNNVYVVYDPDSREAAVLDVGFEPQRVVDWVRAQGLTVRWLLATHAHYDHVASM